MIWYEYILLLTANRSSSCDHRVFIIKYDFDIRIRYGRLLSDKEGSTCSPSTAATTFKPRQVGFTSTSHLTGAPCPCYDLRNDIKKTGRAATGLPLAGQVVVGVFFKMVL